MVNLNSILGCSVRSTLPPSYGESAIDALDRSRREGRTSFWIQSHFLHCADSRNRWGMESALSRFARPCRWWSAHPLIRYREWRLHPPSHAREELFWCSRIPPTTLLGKISALTLRKSDAYVSSRKASLKLTMPPSVPLRTHMFAKKTRSTETIRCMHATAWTTFANHWCALQTRIWRPTTTK